MTTYHVNTFTGTVAAVYQLALVASVSLTCGELGAQPTSVVSENVHVGCGKDHRYTSAIDCTNKKSIVKLRVGKGLFFTDVEALQKLDGMLATMFPGR